MIDFAILAPVPLEHLESGLEVARTKEYVSFGSQKFELFREVDTLRMREEVPVLIYPSYEGAEIKLSFQIGWVGWYSGAAEGMADKRRDEIEGHRPPTTEKYYESGDHAGGWGVFWHVKELRRLPEGQHIPIRKLASYKTGYWRKNAPPRGPEIVARPAWI